MKRFTVCLLTVIMLVSAFTSPSVALSREPSIEAQAAILVDMTTGELLMEKNPDDRHFPASTTKMMTCLLGLENLDLNSDITADYEAASTKGNNINLKDGERMNAGVLLRAMMIPSGNDCAVAVAKTVAGSADSFAVMMNARAGEIGCTGTNFVNPHGIHDDNHYTTARDLSLIALECMKNPDFREIVKTYKYTVPATNKSGERNLTNTNFLLGDEEDSHRIYVGNELRYCKFEGTIGVKTGYTAKAGGCLVAACERDGTTLLCVILASSDLGRFADAIKLFNWGFENYKTYKVLDGGYSFGNVKVHHGEFNKVEAVLLKDVAYTLPMDASVESLSARAVLEEKLTAPVKKGDVLGEVTLYLVDKPVATYHAVAARSVAVGGFLSYFGIEDSAAAVIKISVLSGLGLLFVLLTVYVLVMRRKTKIKKARRAERLRRKAEAEAARRAEWERYYEGSRYRGENLYIEEDR